MEFQVNGVGSSPVVIVGCGRLGRIALDLCRRAEVPVAGWLSDNKDDGDKVRGLPVSHEFQSGLKPANLSEFRFLIAVGNLEFRWSVFRRLRRCHAEILGIAHSSAVISSYSSIGTGSVLHAFVSVQDGAHLGDLVLLEDHVSVGVDVSIGDNVVVGPCSRFAAGVSIERNSFVGIGATILPEVHIGEGCVVGAGAVVTKNVPSGVTVAGVPGKIVEEVRG